MCTHTMKLMNVMGLSTQFLLHIGMDGPNVNLKFQRNILTAVSNAENPSEILEIGTCTLHPVSTAFKKGLQKLSFSFDSFFNNVSFFFKQSSGKIAGMVAQFALKFMSTRWLCIKYVGVLEFKHLSSGQSEGIFPDIFAEAARI